MIHTHKTSNLVWNGLKDQDENILKHVIHPNAVFVHMGATMNRDDEINTVINKGIIYKEVTFEACSIQKFKDVTVLLNTLTLVAIVNNQEVENRFVVTETYTIIDEIEVLISMTFTKIVY